MYEAGKLKSERQQAGPASGLCKSVDRFHRMKLGSRLLPLFLSVPLIGLAVFNLSQLMSDSPAFDASVRTPGIFGDWRVPIRSAYFDLADYQYQLAFGFLQTDVLVSGATEGPDEIASIDTIFDRSARAAELLNSSVALAPGNADAWTALGWAEAFSGDLELARQAMRNSWSLAPYNLDLSFRRVSFYDFLSEVPIEDGDLTGRFRRRPWRTARSGNNVQTQSERLCRHNRRFCDPQSPERDASESLDALAIFRICLADVACRRRNHRRRHDATSPCGGSDRGSVSCS